MTDAPAHDHTHQRYTSESMIAARMCNGCGSYVSSLHLEAHDKLHRDLEIALAANGENHASSSSVSDAGKKGKKK